VSARVADPVWVIAFLLARASESLIERLPAPSTDYKKQKWDVTRKFIGPGPDFEPRASCCS